MIFTRTTCIICISFDFESIDVKYVNRFLIIVPTMLYLFMYWVSTRYELDQEEPDRLNNYLAGWLVCYA